DGPRGGEPVTPATILIVDDEPDLTRLLAEHLQREGFAPLVAHDAETALRLLEETPCDLAILDIMLPGMDGIDLLRRLRQRYDLPAIMLSAKDSPMDKMVGLSLGADDYVGKPFSLLELTARIHAVLRRARKAAAAGAPGGSASARPNSSTLAGTPATAPASGPAPLPVARSGDGDGATAGASASPVMHTDPGTETAGAPGMGPPGHAPRGSEVLRCGPVTVDLSTAQVWSDGKPVTLTPREYQLLAWWLRHPGRVFTKQQIYEAVWGEPYVADDNTVTVHIHRLRAKIERDPERPVLIQTVRGLGYRLVCGP
ncbi:MAG TPA: response regulator transcription factor, partial [Thermaerobacter sp.]